MNEAIIAHHARQHKLISDSLGLSSIDEENERRYDEDSFHTFKVPVTITRRGCVEILARDAESARNVVRVATSLGDDIKNIVQTERIGKPKQI